MPAGSDEEDELEEEEKPKKAPPALRPVAKKSAKPVSKEEASSLFSYFVISFKLNMEFCRPICRSMRIWLTLERIPKSVK